MELDGFDGHPLGREIEPAPVSGICVDEKLAGRTALPAHRTDPAALAVLFMAAVLWRSHAGTSVGIVVLDKRSWRIVKRWA